jgi:hypothetical protein
MIKGQIQVKISLTNQLYDFLLGQSSQLGIPVTQVVKHMIIEKAQRDSTPTFRVTPKVEEDYKQAMLEIDKAVKVEDLKEYFANL